MTAAALKELALLIKRAARLYGSAALSRYVQLCTYHWMDCTLQEWKACGQTKELLLLSLCGCCVLGPVLARCVTAPGTGNRPCGEHSFQRTVLQYVSREPYLNAAYVKGFVLVLGNTVAYCYRLALWSCSLLFFLGRTLVLPRDDSTRHCPPGGTVML